MTLHVIELPKIGPWDFGSLASEFTSNIWGALEIAPLSTLGSTLVPRIHPPGLLLRPRDISSKARLINPIESESTTFGFRFGNDIDDLQIGDLLLSNTRSVIFADSSIKGITFSTRFTAFRPSKEMDPVYLWALLNSTKGVKVRQNAIIRNAFGIDIGIDISKIHIPSSNSLSNSSLQALKQMKDLRSEVMSSRDFGQSWWRSANLDPNDSWGIYLAVRNLDELISGVPLSEFTETIRGGRKPHTCSEFELGALPVFTSKNLKGEKFSKFALPNDNITATAGSIVLQRNGIKGLARVLDQDVVVDNTLVILDMKDFGVAESIVRFLNSPSGQRQRSLHVSGDFIPSLRKEAILKLRVNLDMNLDLSEPKSLNLQIDEVLLDEN